MNAMKDYLLQQMRESSTWRGAIDILIGVSVFWLVGWDKLPALPDEALTAIRLVGGGLIGRGAIAMLAKDTTTAGTATKNAQAQAAVDQGKVVVPEPVPTTVVKPP